MSKEHVQPDSITGISKYKKAGFQSVFFVLVGGLMFMLVAAIAQSVSIGLHQISLPSLSIPFVLGCVLSYVVIRLFHFKQQNLLNQFERQIHELKNYDDGEFPGYRGSAMDVTREVEAEDKFRHNQELIYEATAVLNDGFVLFDADDRLVMCNQRYRDIYSDIADMFEPGVRFEDIVTAAAADKLMDFDSPEERQDWIDTRLEIHNSPKGILDQELSNGDWIRIIEQKLPDGSIVGLRIDITEIKHMEELLENAERISKIASWKWDTVSNRLKSYSREYPPMYGFTDDDFDGITTELFEMIHPDDIAKVERQFDKAVGEIGPYEVEYRIIRTNGEVRYLVERGGKSVV